MARQLKNGNCRLVMSGNVNGPAALRLEYRVVDGDFEETPQKMDFASPDFTATVSEVWQASMSAANTDEEITV